MMMQWWATNIAWRLRPTSATRHHRVKYRGNMQAMPQAQGRQTFHALPPMPGSSLHDPGPMRRAALVDEGCNAPGVGVPGMMTAWPALVAGRRSEFGISKERLMRRR